MEYETQLSLNPHPPSHSQILPDYHPSPQSSLCYSSSARYLPTNSLILIPGQLCTLTTPHGPQVGDLNIFSLSNHREHFWAARTRQLHSSHVSVGDRLWSNLPFLRPLCTVVADSLAGYGVDEVGGRCHDLLGTR